MLSSTLKRSYTCNRCRRVPAAIELRLVDQHMIFHMKYEWNAKIRHQFWVVHSLVNHNLLIYDSLKVMSYAAKTHRELLFHFSLCNQLLPASLKQIILLSVYPCQPPRFTRISFILEKALGLIAPTSLKVFAVLSKNTPQLQKYIPVQSCEILPFHRCRPKMLIKKQKLVIF